MIVYDRILDRLKNAGYTTYRLAKERLISQSTLDSIRKGKAITTTTIDTICTLCDCNPEDILKHIKEEEISK